MLHCCDYSTYNIAFCDLFYTCIYDVIYSPCYKILYSTSIESYMTNYIMLSYCRKIYSFLCSRLQHVN